jgi:hypothetical protein
MLELLSVYFSIGNLVLCAKSEAVGYAVKRSEKNTEFRIRNSVDFI